MSSRPNPSQAAATLLSLLLSGVSPALSSSTFSLGDRIACQTAIEEVYWRHRESAGTKPSFDQTVSRDVIQRKAEDQLLKSLALERYWGVTITGTQLQAELDRMAANSKAPDVLAELFAALDNDPQKAAEQDGLRSVGAYDSRETLVIDPVLSYSDSVLSQQKETKQWN